MVEFSKVLSNIEENDKESQKMKDFDWKEFLRELI